MDSIETHHTANTTNVTLLSNETVDNADTINTPPRDGYDLPLYGIANGMFYFIHIPAMLCLFSSIVCSIGTLYISFKKQPWRKFFKTWKSSEKFVVYLAVCDGLFTLAHFMDHAQIAVTKRHIYPKALCSAFGFVLGEFIAAQTLIVNMIAINVFMQLYFNKQLDYGRWDWRFMLWTYGVPLAGVIIVGIAGHFGPTGSFCFIDRVKGPISNSIFAIAPVFILITNVVLYLLAWKKVRSQVKSIKSMKEMPPSMRAAHKAARVMSLFVVAYVVQWWAATVYGVWMLIVDEVPQAVHHLITVFTNIGGVLNLVVYTVIRRKQL